MTLPLVYSGAVALVTHILSCALTFPAYDLTCFLTPLAFGRSLASTPLTFSPFALDGYTSFSVTMGAENLAFTTTVITAYHLLA